MKGVGRQAEEIVDAIMKDMWGRSGLYAALDNKTEEQIARLRSDWILLARRIIETSQ